MRLQQSLLCGCEVWSLNSADYHKVNVIGPWNNIFSKRERLTVAGGKVLPACRIIAQHCLCHTLLIGGQFH